MNSDQIYHRLGEIAEISGKNDKRAFLEKCLRDGDFKRVVLAALDPAITYGMKKMPLFSGKHGCFTDSTWRLIDALAARELTGKRAQNALADEMQKLSLASAELLERVLTKDLKAGFSESSVNAVAPGSIFVFGCQLAEPYEAKRITKWPAYLEPKFDGVRTLALVHLAPTPTVRLVSRSGKDFTVFDHLKQPLIDALLQFTIPGVELVIDCEVVSGNFNKTVSEVRKKNEPMLDAILIVFDMLDRKAFESPDEEGYCSAGGLFETRRHNVYTAFGPRSAEDIAAGRVAPGSIIASPAELVDSYEEIHRLYAYYQSLGLEGAMVKLTDSYYRLKRSYDWLKLKGELSEDVRIIGAEPGEKGSKYEKTLGALVVDYKGVQVRVSGMKEAARFAMWDAFLADSRAIAEELTFEPQLLGRTCEVLFHEVTPDGSLRHPRFKRFRDDKAAA